MLSASSGTREPLDPEVVLVTLRKGGCRVLHATHYDGDRHRRGVDAAALFRRRNSLDPVAACLVLEIADAFASNLETYGVEPDAGRGNVRAVTLSTLRLCEAFVGLRKFSDEELRVVSALGGTDFQCDDGRHPDVPFPCRSRISVHGIYRRPSGASSKVLEHGFVSCRHGAYHAASAQGLQ
jgi:hypothetical protein